LRQRVRLMTMTSLPVSESDQTGRKPGVEGTGVSLR
jgi:hypothetical protein